MSKICDNFCDSDKGLELFRGIFGDEFIRAFYENGLDNPALIKPLVDNDQLSMVAIMASNISFAALFVIGLIFFSGVLKWVFDSANDGEALGNKGSAIGSVARPIFAIIMLMPTPSKFAVINIITLYFALWGHGFANKAYMELLVGTFDTGILQITESDDMLNRASDMSGAVFSGALSAYCGAYVKEAYGSTISPPIFDRQSIPANPSQASAAILPPSFIGIAPGSAGSSREVITKPSSSFGRIFDGVGHPTGAGNIPIGVKTNYRWTEDNNVGESSMNSAGAICGEITFTLAQNPMPITFGSVAQGSDQWAIRKLSYFTGELNAQMSAYKYAYAQEAYKDGMAIALGERGKLTSGLEGALGSRSDFKPWTTRLDLGNVEADLQQQAATGGTGTGTGTGTTTQPGNSSGIQLGPNQQLPAPDVLISASNWHANRLKDKLKDVLKLNGFTLTEKNGTTAGTTLKCGSTANGGLPNQADGQDPTGVYQVAMCGFLSEVYAGGWINAAPAREKIKQYKMSATAHILDPAYEYSSPSYLATSGANDDQAKKANMFQTAMSSIRVSAIESKNPALPPYSMIITDGISDLSFSGAQSAKSGIIDKLNYSITGILFSAERSLIEFATGTGKNDGVDALTRMQDFGVGLRYVTTAYENISFRFKTGFVAGRFACSLTPGLIKNFALDCGETVKAAKMGFDILWSDMLEGTMRMLAIVAAYFSVFIPTMPFVFLLMAAIGWFIQVFQTIVGMLLWAIMHAIPGGDFIGGQQHGYFALVSLFFRPIIIIVGFFLAFELYDPIITLLVQGYFDMHQSLIMSGSSFELLAAFELLSTWALHLMVLANLVLAATYLVFGLIQELSDTTLEFMGTRVFAGFGNQETKSVAQGSAGTFGSAQQASAMNKRQSKDALKKSRADAAKPKETNGGGAATGGGGDMGGGAAANNAANNGGFAGGGTNPGGSASSGGDSTPFEVSRERGYTASTHSSMVPNVSDSAVQSAVARADKKETFGSFGGKARAAGASARNSAYSDARSQGQSPMAAAGSAFKAGRAAKIQFKREAQAGHEERMDALKSGNERGYNAMYQKHIQEGVAGASPSRQDANSVVARDLSRYGGNSYEAREQRTSLTNAISQAKSDASTIPSREDRTSSARS